MSEEAAAPVVCVRDVFSAVARARARVSVCVRVCVCFTDGVEECGVRSLSRRSGIRSHQIHQTASNYHTIPQLGE